MNWSSRAVATFMVTLHLLLFGACADPMISDTTQFEGGSDESGPYLVHTLVRGAHPGDRVELFYNEVNANPDEYIPRLMQKVDEDGSAAQLYVGELPGSPVGSTIRYYIAIERDGERVATDPENGDLRPYELFIRP